MLVRLSQSEENGGNDELNHKIMFLFDDTSFSRGGVPNPPGPIHAQSECFTTKEILDRVQNMTEPSKNEYDIALPFPDGGYMIRVSNTPTNEVIVSGYRNNSRGQPGYAEKYRLIRNVGDMLVAVDGLPVHGLNFEEVIGMVIASVDPAKKNVTFLRLCQALENSEITKRSVSNQLYPVSLTQNRSIRLVNSSDNIDTLKTQETQVPNEAEVGAVPREAVAGGIPPSTALRNEEQPLDLLVLGQDSTGKDIHQHTSYEAIPPNVTDSENINGRNTTAENPGECNETQKGPDSTNAMDQGTDTMSEPDNLSNAQFIDIANDDSCDANQVLNQSYSRVADQINLKSEECKDDGRFQSSENSLEDDAREGHQQKAIEIHDTDEKVNLHLGHTDPWNFDAAGNLASILVRRCSKHYGWPESYARRAITGYSQFLGIIKNWEDFDCQNVISSSIVRKVWSLHVLDTRRYADDCVNIVGNMVHYNPDNESESPTLNFTHHALTSRFGKANLDSEVWSIPRQTAPITTRQVVAEIQSQQFTPFVPSGTVYSVSSAQQDSTFGKRVPNPSSLSKTRSISNNTQTLCVPVQDAAFTPSPPVLCPSREPVLGMQSIIERSANLENLQSAGALRTSIGNSAAAVYSTQAQSNRSVGLTGTTSPKPPENSNLKTSSAVLSSTGPITYQKISPSELTSAKSFPNPLDGETLLGKRSAPETSFNLANSKRSRSNLATDQEARENPNDTACTLRSSRSYAAASSISAVANSRGSFCTATPTTHKNSLVVSAAIPKSKNPETPQKTSQQINSLEKITPKPFSNNTHEVDLSQMSATGGATPQQSCARPNVAASQDSIGQSQGRYQNHSKQDVQKNSIQLSGNSIRPGDPEHITSPLIINPVRPTNPSLSRREVDLDNSPCPTLLTGLKRSSQPPCSSRTDIRSGPSSQALEVINRDTFKGFLTTRETISRHSSESALAISQDPIPDTIELIVTTHIGDEKRFKVKPVYKLRKFFKAYANKLMNCEDHKRFEFVLKNSGVVLRAKDTILESGIQNKDEIVVIDLEKQET